MLLTTVFNFSQAGIYALLGYGLVFLGLILLMLVVSLLGRIFQAKDKKTASARIVPPTPVELPPQTAPGSAGQLKLHNVDPKTAAMLMAITANKLGKPINELRFVSIREVEK